MTGSTLNTSGRFSHLPGRPYPEGTPNFVPRDQFVAHLEEGTARRRASGPAARPTTQSTASTTATTTGGCSGPPPGKIHTQTAHRRDGAPERSRSSPSGRDVRSSRARCCTPRNTSNPDSLSGEAGPGRRLGQPRALRSPTTSPTGGAGEVKLSVRTPPNIIPLEGTSGEVIASVLYLTAESWSATRSPGSTARDEHRRPQRLRAARFPRRTCTAPETNRPGATDP